MTTKLLEYSKKENGEVRLKCLLVLLKVKGTFWFELKLKGHIVYNRKANDLS